MEVKEYYNEISRGYDELYGEEQTKKVKIIDEILEKIGKKFEICLDAGCGTGISTKMLCKYCNKVIGIDISEKMIEKAKKKIPNTIFLVEDITNTSFRNQYFDLIISVTVLQDIDAPEEALLELKRILKDNGILILTFLKRSSKVNIEMVGKYFKILDVIEEEKDYILVCKKL